MPLAYLTGDLLNSHLPVIGQGVNLQGVMGAGIAAAFHRKYPQMFEDYKHACRSKALTLGRIHTFLADDGVTIVNLATQDHPGANASLDAVAQSLHHAFRYCEEMKLASLALPRIGSGIGGLRWNDVHHLMHSISQEYPHTTLTIVTMPTTPRKEQI